MAMTTATSAHISHFIPCPLSVAARLMHGSVLRNDPTGQCSALPRPAPDDGWAGELLAGAIVKSKNLPKLKRCRIDRGDKAGQRTGFRARGPGCPG